jgi:gluconokinase
MIIVLTGPSGVGKTTVGCLLAERIGGRFFEGDAWHSRAAVCKMTQGLSLTDQDRIPWLAEIQNLISSLDPLHEKAVIACSALKVKYRDFLRADCAGVRFVHLRGEYSLIAQRLRQRQGHFAKVNLLASQFADLEESADGLVVDVALSPAEIVSNIIKTLHLQTE